MQSIINGIILAILTIWIIRLYMTKSEKMRTFSFPYKENTKYVLSPNLYFCIFTVCTAPMFLHPFSLLKYGIWFAVIVILLFVGRLKLNFQPVVICYLLFLAWVLIAASYSSASTVSKISSFIRFALPIFYLWLGYNAIESKYSLLFFSRSVLKIVFIYTFWIGGFAAIYLPFIYYSPVGNGIFLTYAGFADYLTSLFPLPIIMFFLTKRKWYLVIAGAMVLSTVLEVVRTGLGGMFIGSILTLISLYRIKSVPFILGVFLIGVSIITLVPSVREKMFYESDKVSFQDVSTGNRLSTEEIKDNGRYEIWEKSMKELYNDNKAIGSGLGTTSEWLTANNIRANTPQLLHNDYVLILCDMGIVGLVLFIFFSLIFILNCIYTLIKSYHLLWIRIGAILALGSYGGILFSMGYDNVFGHSMTSLINPFIFMGFLLKLKEIYNDKNEQTHSVVSKS